ncbi:putative RNA-directed DNA polymerase [Helianthus annuus]|nr:putative RNA-directed DNA polymerase [Helianthus annuus]
MAGTKKVVNEASAFQAHVSAKQTYKPKHKKTSGEPDVSRCTLCGKDGHVKDGCFKLIRYPDWWPGKGKQERPKPKAALAEVEESPIPGMTAVQYQQFIQFFGKKEGVDKEDTTPMANMAGNIGEEGDWVVDSGATEHISYDEAILKNKRKGRYEPHVTIPNGEAVAVKGRGDYTLPNGMTFNEVLHVPNFKCNLLSGLHSRKLIGVGDCQGGLYRMGMVRAKRQAMVTTYSTWHKRLGHPSNSKVPYFLKNVSMNSKDFCDSCVKAKFTRLPFPVSTTKTHACFDLIHCDVWGKYRTPSLTRANYFLTIVDDFSRAVWVFLLKHKDEASTYLLYFHKMVQTQFEKNIKRVRCDNGGEFTSNRMLEFYANEGIVLETTCPHTPQQNGVVKRKHRHLLETARALRFEQNCQQGFGVSVF